MRLTPAEAARYSGSYLGNAHSYTRNEKFYLAIAPHSTVDVSPGPDGSLETVDLISGTMRWMQVRPGLFRYAAWDPKAKSWTPGQKYMTFKNDPDGRPRYLLNDWAFDPYYRLAWYQLPRFHSGLLKGCGVVFILALAWALLSLLRRQLGLRPPLENDARWLAGLVGGANLVGILILRRFFSSTDSLLYGYTVQVYAALGLLLLSAALTPLVCWLLARRWFHRLQTNKLAHLALTVFTLAALLFLWSAWQWNLLGYHMT